MPLPISAQETHQRFLQLAQRISYPGLEIEVILDEAVLEGRGGRPSIVVPCGHYLRVSCPAGSCNVTGQELAWFGRKWRLSRHMTDMEFVLTAFKALLTAMEHEARELFKVDGVALLDSHMDLDRTLNFMSNGGGGNGRVG